MGFLAASKINKSKFAAVLLLNIGALSWFFILNNYMEDFLVNVNLNTAEYAGFVGNSLVYGFAIFWSIAISFIGNRINRRKLLFISIILGIFSTVLLGFVKGPFLTSIICSLMGLSLGLFLPSSMALVADTTVAENRGRASGIIILGTFIIAFALMAIFKMLTLDLFDLILMLALVRSISLFGLLIAKLDISLTIVDKVHVPAAAYKEFALYLIPWAIFTLASSLAKGIIPPEDFQSALSQGETFRFVLIAIFGLAAGFIADRFGRKQPIFLGLATLGIGYLLLGYNINEISVIIYYALSGITWGLFFVVFLAIPGDLSTHDKREKFYALGYILPLTGVLALSVIPVPEITDFIDANLISQIVGICLFLAMYPVFRAKETLSESKMRERKLKDYVQKLGKAIQEPEKTE